ncbi:MAG: hypothetical protein PHS84_07125, partial [Paludibacter sp.]|nr:hypothetical protein [Paludibacter sp.]
MGLFIKIEYSLIINSGKDDSRTIFCYKKGMFVGDDLIACINKKAFESIRPFIETIDTTVRCYPLNIFMIFNYIADNIVTDTLVVAR